MKLLLINNTGAVSYASTLRNDGFIVENAYNVAQAMEHCSVYYYDLIVADIPSPGSELERLISYVKLKQPHTGIIVISEEVGVDRKIEMLSKGADDYVVRPFDESEFNARILALFRRCALEGEKHLEYKGIKLVPSTRKVTYHGRPIDLTPKEYELFFYMIRNPNKILTYEMIAEYLLGDVKSLAADCFDFIYSHVKNIRKKLARVGVKRFIQTVYGVGYVMR